MGKEQEHRMPERKPLLVKAKRLFENIQLPGLPPPFLPKELFPSGRKIVKETKEK